ncbi:MAG: hypothetical protein ABEK59_12340 [Halobacteria archaeon]
MLVGIWQKLKRSYREESEKKHEVDTAKVKEGLASAKSAELRTKWFWMMVASPFLLVFWNFVLIYIFGAEFFEPSHIFSASNLEPMMIASILVIVTGLLPFYLGIYMDVKKIRELEGVDWDPGLYRYIALSIILSPIVAAPVYLYKRSKEVG